MIRAHALLLSTLLLAAACSSTPKRIFVQKVEGRDGAWTHPGEQGDTLLDTTGDVTTLVYSRRTFVIRGLATFRGHIAMDEVRLAGRDAEFLFDLREVTVRSRRGVMRDLLDSFPEGGMATYKDGSWSRETDG
jgi:hypothetical protein